MNACDNCLSKRVCTIRLSINDLKRREIMKTQINFNLVVDMCESYRPIDKSKDMKKKEIKEEDDTDKLLDSILNKNLKEIESKIGKENKSTKLTKEEFDKLDKEIITINGEEKTLYVCPSCGCKDYSDGFYKCYKCNKILCSDCGVFDQDSNKTVCEKCW